MANITKNNWHRWRRFAFFEQDTRVFNYGSHIETTNSVFDPYSYLFAVFKLKTTLSNERGPERGCLSVRTRLCRLVLGDGGIFGIATVHSTTNVSLQTWSFIVWLSYKETIMSLFCQGHLKYPETRKQSEPAHLRQSHVVRQVAAPYSVWQRFPLCPIESNVNENF